MTSYHHAGPKPSPRTHPKHSTASEDCYVTCPWCTQVVLARGKVYLESDDEGKLVPHAHQGGSVLKQVHREERGHATPGQYGVT